MARIDVGTTVNIVNKFKSEKFLLTDGNSNMNLWWFLAMLGVAGALVPFAFRKKEKPTTNLTKTIPNTHIYL